MQSILTKILLLVLLLAGAFFFGKHVGYSKEREDSLRLQNEYQTKITELQSRSSDVTIKTVVEYKDRVVEKEKKVYVYKDKVVASVVNSCPLSADTVRLLSEAIDKANDADATGRTHEGTKDLETDLKALLENYMENLNRFSANREQLTFLQSWIEEQQKLFPAP